MLSDELTIFDFSKTFSTFDVRRTALDRALADGRLDGNVLVKDCKDKIKALDLSGGRGGDWSIL